MTKLKLFMVKTISLLAVSSIFLSFLVVSASAKEFSEIISSNTIEVGEYFITTEVAQRSRARGTSTAGTKAVVIKDKDNNILCKLIVEAGFTVNYGSNVSCTYSKPISDPWSSNWSVVDMTSSKSSGALATASATANGTFQKRFLGIPVENHPATVTLKCDKYGNLY